MLETWHCGTDVDRSLLRYPLAYVLLVVPVHERIGKSLACRDFSLERPSDAVPFGLREIGALVKLVARPISAVIIAAGTGQAHEALAACAVEELAQMARVVPGCTRHVFGDAARKNNPGSIVSVG